MAIAGDDHTVLIDEVVADKPYHSNQVLMDLVPAHWDLTGNIAAGQARTFRRTGRA
jgi:hypothetical protein